MKAVVCSKYGSPDVLKIEEITKPVPKKHELLIKVNTTAVTVGDSRVRAFRVPLSFWLIAKLILGVFKPRNPVLGSVFSGIVEDVGSDVTEYKKGDRVFGSNEHHFGVYAEYMTISHNACVATLPKGYSFHEAAAVLWGGLTALYFMKKAKITKDDTVLLNGASGSVGGSLLQLSSYLGAKVTGICSSGNIGHVKSLGAHNVIDYTRTDYKQSSTLYDLFIDAVGNSSILATKKILTEKGRFIHLIATPAVQIKGLIALLFSQKKFIGGTAIPNKALLHELKQYIEKDAIKPVIDRVYNMDEIVSAHEYVDMQHKKGDVLIQIEPIK